MSIVGEVEESVNEGLPVECDMMRCALIQRAGATPGLR
jgi:hypothetical protein